MNKIFTIFDNHPEVFTAFSTRADGSMHALHSADNRNRFLNSLGIADKSVGLILVHGSKVSKVSKEDLGKIIPETDALITSESNIFLNITVSDCLPVFFYDPVKKLVALAHAGWRGLENGILKNTVTKMVEERNTNPQDLLVAIGPAICKEHYQIQEDLVEKFKEYPDAIIRKDNDIFLDLSLIAKMQLLTLGIAENNIEISSECTFVLPDKYFSYRRDKPKTVEPMIAVIGLK
jgi:hypothetical protein